MDLFKKYEGRDPARFSPTGCPIRSPIKASANSCAELCNRKRPAQCLNFVGKEIESPVSQDYRRQMNLQGSPSEAVALDYKWRPGTELTNVLPNFH